MDDLFAEVIILIGGVLIILIPFVIIYLIALWKLFKKAGRNGWEAIIPFYNTWVLAEIAGVAWWYALIIILSNFGVLADTGLEWILSLASIVSNFFICYNLSKKFHQDTGFAVLMTVFPLVMIPILGFSSKYQYDGDVVVSENGPIGGSYTYHGNSQESSHSEATMNYEEKKFCAYCGKQLNIAAKFCGNCGQEVK